MQHNSPPASALIRVKPGKAFYTLKMLPITCPPPQDDELKVRMASSRINPVDMDLMKGFPGLTYKKLQIGGVDGAGTVLEAGRHVKGIQAGDPVFFYRKFSDIGTWATEITIKAADCAKVPAHVALTEAGAIALPLLTAYDSLTQLGAQAGEKILIHGAGGGVGFQAVQVAKRMGLFTIGTARQGDRALLEKAGLDQFIDYASQDFAQVLSKGSVQYVFDILGDEILKKSIALQPRKVISVKYVDPSVMHKAGVQLPGILKGMMRLMMGKFDRLARQNHVQLIGQVTGADGAMLQKAIDFVGTAFVSRTYPSRRWEDIAATGLGKEDVGRVILF